MSGIQTTILGQHLRIVSPLWLWIAPLGIVVGVLAALRSALRQEQAGGTRVILDRREPAGSSNGSGPSPRQTGRRAPERRAAAPQDALALMSVLGFMILHRQGERWTT